jgi:DNA-binding NarL/FixJ family response regulator
MSGIGSINLKVVLVDTDFYALQSLNSYLAWDRRTRVTFSSESLEDMWKYLGKIAEAELPDIIILDADHVGGQKLLAALIQRLRALIPKVSIICLTQEIDPLLVEAAAEAGAAAYLSKKETRLHISWAVVFTLSHDFVVTRSVARACLRTFNARIFNAAVLPEHRTYPELTDRIRQAIKLCVVEGMPAHLAADEMGISLHTIRGYIKEGYRILESYDETEYPTDMTPQERAFMRFTALDDTALKPSGNSVSTEAAEETE